MNSLLSMVAQGSSLTSLDWNNFGSAVLGWVGQALVYGTLTALAAWALLALVRRRISPALQGLFWTVVLLKFIVPVGPGSQFSLTSLAHRASSLWNAPAVGLTAAPGQNMDSILVVVTDGSTKNVQVSASTGTLVTGPALSIAALCGIAYLVIVGGITVLRIGSYIRFARRCRALPSVDENARRLVDAVCARHGVRRLADVRISGDVAAPFILGGLRPLLVLSPRQTQPDELEAVVLHEIAHLRRRDMFVRYLQWFAGTLLFFWPVVAWVNRRIDLAREHACDDWALRHGSLSAGDYARCLLRALHRPEPIRLAYRPASMARNLQSVERRIDMIMDSPRQRSIRSLSLPAVLALGAWCAFALTGAKAEETKKTEPTAAQTDGETTKTTQTVSKEVRVIAVAGDDVDVQPGGPMEVKVVKNDQGQMEVQINGKTVKNIDMPNVKLGAVAAFCPEDMEGFVSPKDLEQFGKDHPTADADADGKVTRTERSAYLAALAQSSPAAVLAKFPQADLNKDGTLDALESARLITDNAMDIEEIDIPGGQMATGVNTQGDGKHVMVVRKQVSVAHGEPGAAVPMPQAGADGELPQKLAFRWAGMSGGGASKWLLENVKTTPTAADVARLVPTVEEAPLVRFAEMFPDADTNKDGKVSKDERKAHMDKQMSDVRARMLKRHPEADLDGDGKLSQDEEREYFRKATKRVSRQTAGPGGVFVQKAEGADGEEMTVDIHIESDDAVQVEGGPIIIETHVEKVETSDEKN